MNQEQLATIARRTLGMCNKRAWEEMIPMLTQAGATAPYAKRGAVWAMRRAMKAQGEPAHRSMTKPVVTDDWLSEVMAAGEGLQKSAQCSPAILPGIADDDMLEVEQGNIHPHVTMQIIENTP